MARVQLKGLVEPSFSDFVASSCFSFWWNGLGSISGGFFFYKLIKMEHWQIFLTIFVKTNIRSFGEFLKVAFLS